MVGKIELKKEIAVLKEELRMKERELALSNESKYYLTREGILERDNHSCCICGEKDTILNIHHIRPKDLGGSEDIKNKITLCKGCHLFMHCNPKLIMMEKIKHVQKTKEGLSKAVNVGKRGKDSKPRKRRGLLTTPLKAKDRGEIK